MNFFNRITGLIKKNNNPDDDSEVESKEINIIGIVKEKYKIKIVLIIAAIFFALMGIFFVIMAVIISLGKLGLIDYGDDSSGGGGMSYNSVTENSSFWWPIGSTTTEETDGVTYASGEPSSIVITSDYGNRIDPFSGNRSYHRGVDISGIVGQTNVVAVEDGVVIYPESLGKDTCVSSSAEDGCGGGYGNYIIIKHNDGIYTLYAHLYEGSVLVSSGDVVKQGQLIAKVGSSGRSTGGHLHFEIRVGENSTAATVDPLDYISATDPRKEVASVSFLEMLYSFEGTGPISGDCYKIYADTGGVLTVGHGVTLIYNKEAFSKRGINVDDYQVGDTILIATVDDIEKEIIAAKRNSVVSLLNSNNISLEYYQIDALVMRMYNTGNINGFSSAYQQYGDTQSLYDNYMAKPVTDVQGNYLTALERRREMEWNLFHNGIYEKFHY